MFTGLWPRHCQARGGGSPHERERQLLRARNQDGHLADPQGEINQKSSASIPMSSSFSMTIFKESQE